MSPGPSNIYAGATAGETRGTATVPRARIGRSHMLWEWARALTTPAPWRLRRLGHVRESVLLRGRSQRCRNAWAPHLAAARETVREAARACPGRDRAVVLGSGLLDDVPLEDLAAAFATVVLVDAVHPRPSRRRAARLPNVRLATADLSGVAPDGRLGDPLADLATQGVAIQGIAMQADLVVSANLLSQLPILPLDRLGTRAPPGLGAGIVRAHLAALPRLGRRICLIADTEAREIGRDGTVLAREELLHGVGLGTSARGWDWELAPFGEESRRYRVVHRVAAFPDWRPPDEA